MYSYEVSYFDENGDNIDYCKSFEYVGDVDEAISELKSRFQENNLPNFCARYEKLQYILLTRLETEWYEGQLIVLPLYRGGDHEKRSINSC